jgi:hypothetical protein
MQTTGGYEGKKNSIAPNGIFESDEMEIRKAGTAVSVREHSTNCGVLHSSGNRSLTGGSLGLGNTRERFSQPV